MKKNILFLAFIAFILASCDKKEEYENEMSGVVEAAGEWFVTYDHADYGADPFGVGYTTIITYNTAADVNNQMWISDLGHFWEYTGKIPVDLGSMTFGSSDTVVSIVSGYEIKMIIENGGIFKNAKTDLPSGAATDSIYFEIFFEDLEGATGIPSDRLQVSGYRRTGFLEDEH